MDVGLGAGVGAGVSSGVGTGAGTDAGTAYCVADTPERLKHFAADIEARAKMVDPPGALIAIVRDYNQEVMHAVTKYHDIEKRSTTLMKLHSGKTVNSGGPNRAYVGKGRVLTVKEVNIGIAKLLKKKEDEEAAAVWKAEHTEGKKTQDLTKAAQEALYQAACDAALTAGLLRPKKPRAPQVCRGGGGTGTSGTTPPAAPSAPPLVAARVATCPAVHWHLQTHSEHAGKATGWEDSAELDELEAVERVRVVQIREFFEVSQHVAELAIIY